MNFKMIYKLCENHLTHGHYLLQKICPPKKRRQFLRQKWAKCAHKSWQNKVDLLGEDICKKVQNMYLNGQDVE